jgi:hypothetical protein
MVVRQIGITSRALLAPHFPEATEEQLQKALENAAFLGYLKSIPSIVPGETGKWQFIEQPANSAASVPVVVSALRSRSLIEVAWANFYAPATASRSLASAAV